MSVDPRSRPQRRRDTEYRLTHDIDVWDGEALLMATPTDSPTGRNLAAPAPFGWGWATPATCP
jgi:hypothetical protein